MVIRFFALMLQAVLTCRQRYLPLYAVDRSALLMGSQDTKYVNLLAEGGHRVALSRQINGKVSAMVDICLPEGFSRKLQLPAYIQHDTNLQKLLELPESEHRYRVCVKLGTVGGFVFVGGRGLRGGNPTALHEAVYEGNFAKTRKMLLSGDFTFGEVDEQGRSALHCAIIQKHWAIAAYIIRHGAKTNMLDAVQKSAVDYADQGHAIYLSTVEEIMQELCYIDERVEAALEKGGSEFRTEVVQALNKVSKLLEVLEGVPEYEQVYHELKYVYHSTKASYLKVIGQYKDATHQEDLAQRYRATDIISSVADWSTDDEHSQKMAAQFSGEMQDTHTIEEARYSYLKQVLQQLMQANVIHEKLISSVEAFVEAARCMPSDYYKYCQLCADRAMFEQIMEETIAKCMDKLSQIDVKPIIQQLQYERGAQVEFLQAKSVAEMLEKVRLLVCDHVDRLRLAFIEQLLTCPGKVKHVLFSNLVVTKANVIQRHKELAGHFHPDRARWLPVEHRGLASDLMGFVNHVKDELVEVVTKQEALYGQLAYYEQQGNEMWGLAMNCQHQIQQIQLSHSQHMDYSDLVEDLKRRQVKYTLRALEHYRSCCKVADNSRNLKCQLRFRCSLALTSYAVKQFLEAQLFALAALNLILDNSQHFSQEDVNYTKKILEKVQGKSQKQSGIQRAHDALNSDSRALILVEKDKYRPIFTSTVGGSVNVAGAGLGLASLVAGGSDVLAGFGALSRFAMLGPGFGIVAGVATVGLGLWAGNEMIKKGNRVMQEPVRRENLDNILQKALQQFDQGNPQGFLEALTQIYCPDEKKGLFSLSSINTGVPTDDIIDQLKIHGFRPDGIAYLFNIMGEALCSGKVQISHSTSGDLLERAVDCFKASLHGELVEQSVELDARISRKRSKLRKDMLKETGSWLKDKFLLRDEHDLATVHLESAQKMPFQVRLQEMRNVANLNLAVARILKGKPEEIIAAKYLVQEVRKSVDEFAIYSAISQMRLAAIEDFLWLVTGQPVEQSPGQITLHKTKSQIVIDEEQPSRYLAFISEQLTKATTWVEKSKLYQKQAYHYVNQARLLAPVHRLDSLRAWQRAQISYASALGWQYSEESAIGYARCLVEQCNYSQAIKTLEPENLEKYATVWILSSKIQLKTLKLNQAQEFAIEALLLDPRNQEAIEQKKLVEKTQQRVEQHKLEPYRSSRSILDKVYYASRHDNSPSYTIVSVDGGGVRGVLAALWLSEIEFRTKRPIAHTFNMIAGTSTGGITAAGLSVPRLVREQHNAERLCDFRPRHSAIDLVDLYRRHSQKIFGRSSYSWVPRVGLNKSKYTAGGRWEVLKQYFHKATMKDALTELVIPAVKEDLSPHVFSRYNSQQDPTINVQLSDAAMSTTAAPTFFPAHYIAERGTFLDGGIQSNNPSMIAYLEAIRYGVPNQKIMMISMGSGTCILDPKNADAYSGQLFWATENQNVSLATQEGEIDKEVRVLLNSRYQRWQVWLDQPIRLNAFDRVEQLIDIGHSFLEEWYSSDQNYMNKLLETLDDHVCSA